MENVYRKIVNYLKPQTLVNLSSLSGVGKTTVLIHMAFEHLCDGKAILFITGDTTKKIIIDKVSKLVKNKFGNANMTKGASLKVIERKNLKWGKNMYDILDGSIFEVVIIDSIFEPNLIDILREIAVDYHCVVIFSSQLNSDAIPNIHVSNEKVLKSDICFSITKTPELSFLDKVKYFFLFWKQKPNRTIKVFKNRFGKEFSEDVVMDFSK